MSDLQPYIYDPLVEALDIRLLLLEPGQPGDELRCMLFTASLTDAVEYEALSYVWGDQKEQHSLICSDAFLHLTTNLDCALSHLRSESELLVLWIDAICINQTMSTSAASKFKSWVISTHMRSRPSYG